MTLSRRACLVALLLAAALPLPAADAAMEPAPLPATGAALLRVAGSLLLVFALLFGVVWLAKNWKRISHRKGRVSKLRLLEAQSLGVRQGVYVVAYEQQRFLVAASPNGVSLLSHLPELSEEAEQKEAAAAPVNFLQALQSIVSRPS